MFDKKVELIITEEKGLHFRAMSRFNKICKEHDVEVVINKSGSVTKAKSTNTMAILLLGIAKGDYVDLVIQGLSNESINAASRDFNLEFAS